MRQLRPFRNPCCLLLSNEHAVRLKVANKFLFDYSLEALYEVGSEQDQTYHPFLKMGVIL